MQKYWNFHVVFCLILQNHINGKKIDFTNGYFDLGYLICSDDCHPFFQDRNHSQLIESSPALWIANDKASFSWADVMIMSHIKYNSRRPSSYKVCKIREFFMGWDFSCLRFCWLRSHAGWGPCRLRPLPAEALAGWGPCRLRPLPAGALAVWSPCWPRPLPAGALAVWGPCWPRSLLAETLAGWGLCWLRPLLAEALADSCLQHIHLKSIWYWNFISVCFY